MKTIIILVLCFICIEASAQKVTADIFKNRTPKIITGSTINCDSSQVFTKTLSANTTLTFTNMPVCQWVTVFVTNTASNYTVTWSGVTWSGGVAPIQTIGVKTDIWAFIKIGSIIFGAIPSQNY